MKSMYMAIKMFIQLLIIPRPNYILLQNPPCIPTMFICVIVSFLRGSTFAIDWHNLGFTILSLKLPPKEEKKDKGKKGESGLIPPGSEAHILVRLAYHYERILARTAKINLCVSNGMKKWLKQYFNIEATTVYDKPPDFVGKGAKETEKRKKNEERMQKKGSSTLTEMGEVLDEQVENERKANELNRIFKLYHSGFDGFSFDKPKIAGNKKETEKSSHSSSSSSSSSDFTFSSITQPADSPTKPFGIDKTLDDPDVSKGEKASTKIYCPFVERDKDGRLKLKESRPALLVSPTSWTPDEDFTPLREALVKAEEEIRKRHITNFPRVLLCITGKGPLLSYHLSKLHELHLSFFSAHPLWLESADYPRFLSCADAGVSMHQSSSGIDLPMKVVDMFGCGVPAIARQFKCINELVKDNVNGVLFDTSQQLTEHLLDLLNDFPHNEKLSQLSKNVQSGTERWTSCWSRCAKPLFPPINRKKD
eukprot:MONOS_6720.1-p1 / transcript=MONOS_6720.1 / gene=MONOS_6720 / organism=Monocercomonoides_exilis_PA203 / gene_product=Chitobiosyldiphosphodolichol beta-mannosyltransferase, family GT33 / transcript_product=Chitobiosyldiphosphodolichol beta-mannosyltransferase, family GT33 / location=Mono_scaffold00216:81079-83057(-) / protein_length=477 / sequence_SO=supercontig / SO=protein_coding / is_pseudo=false